MATASSNQPHISVIVPVHNGQTTIGICLEALSRSSYRDFEVIVVDDRSTDDTRDIVRRSPYTLIELSEHGGASVARNRGAEAARGEVLFFIDADCVVLPDTIERAAAAYDREPDAVTGGTYTPQPFDPGFFNMFQSVFINYSETKRAEPDYVATHAMLISRKRFLESGGFPETFMPILEDVEFSHRLRARGTRLLMAPEVMVLHIFNFSFIKSLRNAFRKSRYWFRYSLEHKDLAADSGTASLDLKVNGIAWVVTVFAILISVLAPSYPGLEQLKWSTYVALIAQVNNLYINRFFFRAMMNTGDSLFFLLAYVYYLTVYPAAIWAGVAMGVIDSIRKPFTMTTAP